MHRFTIRVRYGDTDQMGFAYYGNYLRWFEIGRAELMRSLGLSYRDIEARGVWLPVLEARCRYLRPARYDDEVVIETGIRELGRASTWVRASGRCDPRRSCWRCSAQHLRRRSKQAG